MKLKELCTYLDAEVPLSFQESYDNAGLQVGNPEMDLTAALLVLDVSTEVLDEALITGCNIIISHHPLIFRSLKSISGATQTERILIKAIKNDIAIYSSHTNLDVLNNGVSYKMAEKLKLKDLKVLSPLKNKLMKLVTYIPESHLDIIRKAVFEAGAGVTGNYDSCSFVTAGTGSFRGDEKSKPFVGELVNCTLRMK